MGGIVTLLILSFLIFFHELGHFLVAKLFGVRVLVFSIGFGRRIASFSYKGTIYAISLIPLGGYVALKTNNSDDGASTSLLARSEGDVSELLASKDDAPRQSHKASKNASSAPSTKTTTAGASLAKTAPMETTPIKEGTSQAPQAVQATQPTQSPKLAPPRDVKGDALDDRPPLVRILILLAGAFFNFILASIIYLGIALGIHTALAPIIGEIDSSKVAARYLKKGDRILMVDGVKIQSFNDLYPLLDSPMAKHIVYERDGVKHSIIIVPEKIEQKSIFNDTITRYILGIRPSGEKIEVSYSLAERLEMGANMLYNASFFIIKGIYSLITGMIAPSNIGSVVSIVKVTYDASQVGVVAFFNMAAIISINLGILNLLPIPALDGGLIVFNLYELVTRRRINAKVERALLAASWGLLITLMLYGLYNDLNHLMP